MATKHPFEENPRQWLVQQAQTHNLTYLLAHTDDGVIWGKVNDQGQLITSADVFADLAIPLRAVTVQQLRLFGKDGELLLWKNDDGFQDRLLTDSTAQTNEVEDEAYLLWGQGKKTENGFTWMEEGAQGFYHAVPLSIGQNQEVRLTIRHYIQFDSNGQAHIALSRLVSLDAA